MFYTISNNQIVYNYQKSLDFITQKGRDIYGYQFELLSEDMPPPPLSENCLFA